MPFINMVLSIALRQWPSFTMSYALPIETTILYASVEELCLLGDAPCAVPTLCVRALCEERPIWTRFP